MTISVSIWDLSRQKKDESTFVGWPSLEKASIKFRNNETESDSKIVRIVIFWFELWSIFKYATHTDMYTTQSYIFVSRFYILL